MIGDRPAPFLGECGKKDGNGCGQTIQMRPEGAWPDGRPRWHPYDVDTDPFGNRKGTDRCHFLSCPKRRNFGKGYCNVHRPRKPPHEHEFVAGTEFDLARGVKVSFKKCPCGVKLETGVVS